MKKIIVLICLTAITISLRAQLFVPAGTDFYVAANTIISTDSFTLKPATAFNLAGFNVSKNYTAVTVLPGINSIKRIYNFGNTLTNFSGEAGFYYDETELNGHNETDLQIAYDNGSGYSLVSGSIVNSTSNFINYIFSTPVNLNTVTAASLTALPITLYGFNAYKENKRVKLQWSTLTEQNSSYFIIERSNDGIIYQPLKTLQAAGNSITIKNYLVYDDMPLTAKNFYRLIQYDLNGNAKYFGVRTIEFDNVITISAYPNPVKNIIYLKRSAAINKPATIYINDANGKRIVTSSFTGSTMELNIANFAQGVYVINYVDEIQQHSFKIIKQ